MSSMPGDVEWLQKFYGSLCKDEWNESYGFKISTIDNPGWTFSFDLKDTDFAASKMEYVKIERTDDDWLHYWIRDFKFGAAGGPRNLSEILATFRAWVETESAAIQDARKGAGGR